ncbi:MAG: nuclear transport factor 2 family protein [Betaproteobacteria bacterium]|nr:nuclear transport factor 2 family protein [Betaproteobacteria bacterium]
MINMTAAIAATLAALIFSGCTTLPSDRQIAATDEEHLLALEREWVEAEVKHDRQALERILDERLVVVYASGKTSDRTDFIKMILSKPIAPYKVINDMVRVFGDTAVVVDRFGPGLATKVTWVAIKRDGRWRVISETFSRVAEAGMK